jgi:hypothetical protein
MTDTEYAAILRRAVIMIVTASIKKFSLSWLDFMPRDFIPRDAVTTTVYRVGVGVVVVREPTD